MIVASCQHESVKRNGKDHRGRQRFRCKLCGHDWIEDTPEPLGDMRISMKQATTALKMLLEGLSMRAVSRITGLDRGTVNNLILTVGENCAALMESIKGVEARDVQADEIWSFLGIREKRRVLRGYDSEAFGDIWTWIALESNSKLVLSYRVGGRDIETCRPFLERLRDATTGRFQLSTDGLAAYRLSVPFILRERVDFGQLVKNYESTQVVTRYSPAKIISAEKKTRFGNPDHKRICTSHVESLNQKLRMCLRRFARLTNAHSKGLQQHKAMQAIFFAWYNWAREHDTLKTTPAVASGLTEKVWTMKELLENAAQVAFTARI